MQGESFSENRRSIGSHAGYPKPEKRIKKTMVSIHSTKTGTHSFLVDAEVDETGKARISLAQHQDLVKRAGIQNDETFSFGY